MSTQLSVLAVHAKLFMTDIVPLLGSAGCRVVEISPAELTVARFDALCRDNSFDFVLTVNFSPEVAFLSSRAKVLYVSWTVDPLPPSRWVLVDGTDPTRCLVFSHRRSLVPTLQARGFDAHHLPLAASPRRSAEARIESKYPITFVANSLVGEAETFLETIEDPDRKRRARLWLERSELGDAFDDRPLKPDDVPAWLDEAPTVDRMDAILGALSHGLRMRRAKALVPLGLHVWGDPGWRPLGKRFHGAADHGEQLTTIYRSSTLSLDVPRVYQRDIVTMRVFDAIAAGSVVVCEPSAELGQMFDAGRHVVTYEATADLPQVVTDALLDPTRTAAIARAAAEHVEASHRIEHRVAFLLEAVRQRTA